MNLACDVMSRNKEDTKVREISEYLFKVAQLDKSFLIR
jgi:hypothetical protein